MEFFHLFDSREDSSIALFTAVSEGVISGKHDFARYLATTVAPAQRQKRRRLWPF